MYNISTFVHYACYSFQISIRQMCVCIFLLLSAQATPSMYIIKFNYIFLSCAIHYMQSCKPLLMLLPFDKFEKKNTKKVSSFYFFFPRYRTLISSHSFHKALISFLYNFCWDKNNSFKTVIGITTPEPFAALHLATFNSQHYLFFT